MTRKLVIRPLFARAFNWHQFRAPFREAGERAHCLTRGLLYWLATGNAHNARIMARKTRDEWVRERDQ